MGENQGKKIGIMGGTFDPIHIGHLIIAENARDKYHLDKILVMPNGNPKYKSDRKITKSQERIQMIELAIQNNDSFCLSTIETERLGYTYTYETLTQLKQQNPQDEYYFIMGADSLFSFETWKHPELICSQCVILLANRYHKDENNLDMQIEKIKEKFGAIIYKLDCPNIDISSKMIRSKVKSGQSIRYFVPSEVENYIQQKQLYCQEDKYAEK